MIKDNLKIHDRMRFEVKIGYELSGSLPSTSYKIDSYFFIPNNLGINEETYSRSDFFNDLQVYIRLKTPAYVLDDLNQENNLIFSSLKDSMLAATRDVCNKNIQNYEKHLKLFCCIFKASLRDYVDYIYHKKSVQDEEILIKKFLTSVHAITTRFRQMRELITVPGFPEKSFSIYLFSDEYMSLLVEQSSSKIVQILKHRKRENSELSNNLFELLNAETNYRKENKYPTIASSDSDNEEFLFRFSVLKKYMGSILFLKLHRQKRYKLIEHLLFAFAAGISMIVATSIAFYCQIRLGNLTFPFFVALVISYMFKDRIKEIFKQYFLSTTRKYLHDQNHSFFYNPEQTIGSCSESVDFCVAESVPEKVLELRNCDHITEIENGWCGQSIIHYQRHIQIFSSTIRKTLKDFPVKTVNDILRFNISKFLENMDNPQKILYCVSGSDLVRVASERVYHINLVMRFLFEDHKERFKRFRIILNRKGILRVEEVGLKLVRE
jgi:hypothetical protein